MPIYEYECIDCRNSFELMRSISEDDSDINCPECSSSKVKKVLSVFSSSSIQGCSSCTSSNCVPT
jgi:putative FmdB family regulatory protein